MTLSNKMAIVGVGATKQGKLPGSSSHTLAVDAFKLALADSGLQKSDIDGLLTMPGTTADRQLWMPTTLTSTMRRAEACGTL